MWDDFYELYCRICSDYLNDVEIDQLQGDINEWIELFLKCFPTDNVTPYIHAFACHVCEFLKKYNNISYFNQQGLEKLNDTTTKMFSRGTSMRGSDALKQLMLRRSRITILENEGHTREKRDIHCRNCQSEGHTTCSTLCSSCDESVCCRHLEKTVLNCGKKVWVTSCSLSNTNIAT